MYSKNTTHKIVMTAMFTALTCVATMIIKVPSPFKGYVNIGDCVVLLASWALSPLYAFIAAGLGSALADVFSGYIVYAPATFVIKGIMALIAYYISKITHKKTSKFSQAIGGAIAEIWMIIGYFVFECFLYGFASSLINIPANAIQGIISLILGFVLIKIFEKNNLSFK